MDIQAIMVTIGAIAFFSGIFGGIKIQGLEIPSLPIWGRATSVIIGAFFIGVASWPFVRDNILLPSTPPPTSANLTLTPTDLPMSKSNNNAPLNAAAAITASPTLQRPTATPSPLPATPSSNAKKTSASSVSGETLSDNDVWINSYPTGAEIYLVPATVSIYDLVLEDVMTPQNLLGNAPLTHELPPGKYFVVAMFSSDIFIASGYALPKQSDPTFEYAFPFDGNLSQSLSFIGGEEIGSLSKTYWLMKGAHGSESLISIALPLPESQRGEANPTLYPTLATVESIPPSYTFKEDAMRRAIEDNLRKNHLTTTVDSEMVDEMIDVLQRVGKVKLDTDAVDMIVQMKGIEAGDFSISIYE